jgi:hypothetical protein
MAEAWYVARGAVTAVPRAFIRWSNYGTGTIQAHVVGRRGRWQDIITITVASEASDRSIITILSKPALLVMCIDYGDSLWNVEAIARRIEEVTRAERI